MSNMKIWEKLKKALTRSRENIKNNFNRIILNKSIIDDAMLESLEEILIQADIGVNSTNKIIESIKEKVKKGVIKDPNQIMSFLQEEIYSLLTNNKDEILNNENEFNKGKKPFVIMVVGVNGVGKTTTIGKLAYYYRQVKGKKVMVAAADTFRAAAIEQLEIWCSRAECDIIKQKIGADAASVAYDALISAQAKGHEILIIDTAGRLHTKTNLMEELKKVKRVIKKLDPDAPHKILLVLDANTGQNALQQAIEFNKAVEVNGLILTKLDSTAKGGIVLSIKQALDIPVCFIGIGEKIEDFEKFDSREFARAIIE